jgi:hypothetical protein
MARILIADLDPSSLKADARLLRQLGHTVEVRDAAAAAASELDSSPPDVLVYSRRLSVMQAGSPSVKLMHLMLDCYPTTDITRGFICGPTAWRPTSAGSLPSTPVFWRHTLPGSSRWPLSRCETDGSTSSR